jgi:hypothetical protein
MGNDADVRVAEFTAAIPSAIWRFPAVSLLVVNCTLLGIFMIIAIKHRARWSGLIVIAIGLVLLVVQPQPGFMLMQNRVVVQADTDALLVDGKLGNFEKNLMLQHTGKTHTEEFPCDGDICDLNVKGKTIRLIRTVPALDKACDGKADLILTRLYLDKHCRGTLVIDRHDLNRGGGQAIFLDKTICVESAMNGKHWRP